MPLGRAWPRGCKMNVSSEIPGHRLTRLAGVQGRSKKKENRKRLHHILWWYTEMQTRGAEKDGWGTPGGTGKSGVLGAGNSCWGAKYPVCTERGLVLCCHCSVVLTASAHPTLGSRAGEHQRWWQSWGCGCLPTIRFSAYGGNDCHLSCFG